MMGWYNDAGLGTGGWITMILTMILFWGAVIFAGMLIFRDTTNARGSRDSERLGGATVRNPMDILDERFARGELENKEYEARKTVLLGMKR